MPRSHLSQRLCPTLQVGGQVDAFLTQQLGYPIPSPAIFANLGNDFRKAVKTFARHHGIPLFQFKKRQRKIDAMRPFLIQAAGTPGVVAIGVAQEFQSVMVGYDRATRPGAVNFGFQKAERRVTVYYFDLWDEEFGPGFIKLGSYFPFPGKLWCNGHEWAKRQDRR